MKNEEETADSIRKGAELLDSDAGIYVGVRLSTKAHRMLRERAQKNGLKLQVLIASAIYDKYCANDAI